jgi:DNA polymerase
MSAKTAAALVEELRAALELWRAAGLEWVGPAIPGPVGRPADGERLPVAPAEAPPLAPGAEVPQAARPEAPGPRPAPAAPARDLFGNPVVEAPRGRGGAGLLAAAEPEGPIESLEAIRERMGDCRRCKLWQSRTNLVFGVGDPQARLMFVGEGPGRDEDLRGEPFVGRAGQLLDKIIAAIGLDRGQVYIANVVKSRPPENRLPEADEVAACQPFLRAQIAAIRPEIIVALGSLAVQTLLGTTRGITGMRGRFHEAGAYRVMPTFHPAYLLRNPAAKRDVWEDMKLVRDALAGSPGRPRPGRAS